MIKAVIFDLDGVLVSTDQYHFHSWEKIADDEHFSFFNYEFNHKFRGVGRAECIDIITAASGREYSSESKKELAERKNGYFLDLLRDVSGNDLLPGSAAMLEELRRRKIKTAVASNSRNAQFIIDKTAIRHLLDAVADGYDIQNSKPDPEVFLLAAQKINALPEECLVVEDAVAGIIAAQRAGMKSLGIGSPEMLPNAKIVVQNLASITVDELLAIDQ